MYFYLLTLDHTYGSEPLPIILLLTLSACMKVTVVILCVSVTKLAATYNVPRLQVQTVVLYDSLWCFKRVLGGFR